MTRSLAYSLRACLIGLVLLTSGASAGILKDQVVTYADFSYINSISSSFEHVYFATTNGITRYNKMTQRWEDPLTGGEGLGSEQVLKVLVDEFDQHLYAETATGYYEYDSLFDRWSPLVEAPKVNNVESHIKPPATMFSPPGFNYPGDGQLIDPEGRSFGITDVLDDGAGNLWFGTWGDGAATASGTSRVLEPLPYGLIQNEVNTVVKFDGQLWLGGAALDFSRTGVTIFDAADNSFSYIEPDLFNDLPSADITCLDVNERFVYLGTTEGLLYLDRAQERVTRRFSTNNGLPNANIYSLALIGDSLFVGTEEGLAVATSSGDSAEYVLPSRFNQLSVYDLLYHDSLLWVATSEGVFRLLLNSGRWQQFVDPDNYLSGDVFAVAAFKDQIVFAARDGVVWANGSTGDIELLMQSDRTASPVLALAINDKIVTAASDNGFTLIHYSEKHHITRRFTTLDGLPSNNIYDLLIDGDYVWVASVEGLTRFWWNNPSRVD